MGKIKFFEDKYYFMSNFSRHGFKFNGNYYKTNEHFFQAQKAKTTEDFNKILNTNSPGNAKQLGRNIELREDWEEVKDKIMCIGLVLKFKNNPELIKNLLDTKNKKLIEGNYWHDNYWGDCICKECSDIEGKNKLGLQLMDLRAIVDDLTNTKIVWDPIFKEGILIEYKNQ